jgi:hypothetical protein
MRLDVKRLIRSTALVMVAGTALVGAVARADDDDDDHHHHWKNHHRGYIVVPPGHAYYYVPAPPPVVYYSAPAYGPAYPEPGPPGLNLNFNVPLR